MLLAHAQVFLPRTKDVGDDDDDLCACANENCLTKAAEDDVAAATTTKDLLLLLLRLDSTRANRAAYVIMDEKVMVMKNLGTLCVLSRCLIKHGKYLWGVVAGFFFSRNASNKDGKSSNANEHIEVTT